MTKYKNKDGIELSYDGHENNYHANLVKEVVQEGLKLLDKSFSRSAHNSLYILPNDIKKCKKFFELNFALND